MRGSNSKSIVFVVKAYKQSMSIKNIGFCNLSRAIDSTLVLLELGDEFGDSHGGPKIST